MYRSVMVGGEDVMGAEEGFLGIVVTVAVVE